MTAQPSALLPTINPLYRLPTVEQGTGKKRSTIYREIKNGLFPKPVKIGGDRSAWPANEVQAVIDARIAGETEENIKALVSRLHKARTQHQAPACTICQASEPHLDGRGLCPTCAAYNSAGQSDANLISKTKVGQS